MTTPAPITSWRDVDERLGRLRTIDAKSKAIAADIDKRIQELVDEKTARLAPLTAERDELHEAIGTFAAAHRTSLPAGKKSLRLAHGVVGWRKGTPKVRWIVNEADAVGRLRARGHVEVFQVKETIDKSALRELPPTELEHCGVQVVQSTSLYIKLHEEPLVEYPELPVVAAPENAQ